MAMSSQLTNNSTLALTVSSINDMLECTTETIDTATKEDENAGKQSWDTTIVMIIIGSFGILGNSFVLWVILSSKRLRQRLANVLIINQSCIDCVAGVLLIADSTTKSINGYAVPDKGLAGELFCKLWVGGMWHWSMLEASTHNLMAITVERYMMVVHPVLYKTAYTRQRALCVAAAVWMLGFCYELGTEIPTTVTSDGVCIPYSKFPSIAWQKAYGFITITLIFFVPLVVHPTLYTHMLLVLRRRSKVRGRQVYPASAAAPTDYGGQANRKLSRAQRNLLHTVAIVTACFFLCWSWSQLRFLVYNLGYNIDLSSSVHTFSFIAVNLNCCINPLIYIWKYDDFKRAARMLVCRKAPLVESTITTSLPIVTSSGRA